MITTSAPTVDGARLALALAFALIGTSCDGASQGSGDKDAPDAGSDADAADAGPDASGGTCNPFGTWKLVYDPVDRPDGGLACQPAGLEDVMIVSTGMDGQPNVTFETREPGQSSCGTPRTIKSVSSADGCTMRATWEMSWCWSGETQCEDRVVDLVITGDSGTGTLQYRKCWCATVSPPFTLFSARGTRLR